VHLVVVAPVVMDRTLAELVDHTDILVVLVDHTLMLEVAAVALAELVPTGQEPLVVKVEMEINCHLHSVIQDKHHQTQLTHNLL
tara:strand:+ start:285 stop:536 length:252 start_codon:yes stop_codon:yes gene_type:complete